jgi:hypothetical protein
MLSAFGLKNQYVNHQVKNLFIGGSIDSTQLSVIGQPNITLFDFNISLDRSSSIFLSGQLSERIISKAITHTFFSVRFLIVFVYISLEKGKLHILAMDLSSKFTITISSLTLKSLL